MINYNLILLHLHHGAREKRRVMLAFLRLNFCPISGIGKLLIESLPNFEKFYVTNCLILPSKINFFSGLMAQWNTFSFDSLLANAN